MTFAIRTSTLRRQSGASLVLVMLILTFLVLLTTSLGIKYMADIKRYRGVLLANEMLRTQDLVQTFVNRYASEIEVALKDTSSASNATILIGRSSDRTAIEAERSGKVLYMESAQMKAMAGKLNIKGLDAHLAAQPYYLEFSLSSAENVATSTRSTHQAPNQNTSRSRVQSLLVRQPQPVDHSPDPAIIRSALQAMGIGAGLTIPDVAGSATSREIRFTHSKGHRPDFTRDIPINSASVAGLLVLRSVAPHPASEHLPTLGGEKGFFSVHGDTLQGKLDLKDREIKAVWKLIVSEPQASQNGKTPSFPQPQLTIYENTISTVGPLNFAIGNVTFGSKAVGNGNIIANSREQTNIIGGTLASKKLEISTPFALPDGVPLQANAKPNEHLKAFRFNEQGVPERFDKGNWHSLIGPRGADASGRPETGDRGPKGPRGNRGPKDYVDPKYEVTAPTKTFTIHFGKDEIKWGHHIAKFFSDGEWLSCRLQNHKDTWTQQPKIAYFPPGGPKPVWMDSEKIGKPGWYLVRRGPDKELNVEVKCFGLEIVASTQRREPITERAVAVNEVPIWLEDR